MNSYMIVFYCKFIIDKILFKNIIPIVIKLKKFNFTKFCKIKKKQYLFNIIDLI